MGAKYYTVVRFKVPFPFFSFPSFVIHAIARELIDL